MGVGWIVIVTTSVVPGFCIGGMLGLKELTRRRSEVCSTEHKRLP